MISLLMSANRHVLLKKVKMNGASKPWISNDLRKLMVERDYTVICSKQGMTEDGGRREGSWFVAKRPRTVTKFVSYADKRHLVTYLFPESKIWNVSFNLVPRVSLLPVDAPRDGKKRDPGNEVAHACSAC